jgi:hypothetical protein
MRFLRLLKPGPQSLRSTLRDGREWRRRRERLRYDADGFSTVHATPFLDDPRFRRAYAAGVATGSWEGQPVEWRAHVGCWAALQGTLVEGDFVECGVNRGALSATILEFAGKALEGRTFWLLDTFHGLVDECLTPAERAVGIRAGQYEECYEDVLRTFGRYPNVRVVRGAVPGTLASVTAEKVAYLSIDMNCVMPEIAAAEHFWPRMSPGAVLLLDDYGWSGHEEQRKAFDAFAAARGLVVLALPTGQGVILKPLRARPRP